MIKRSYQRFFATLANENRLRIIRFLLKNGSGNVTKIVTGTKLEQTLVSHNLQRLLDCHFVTVSPNGKERIYSLNKTTIAPLLKLMDRHVSTYCVHCDEDDHG